MITLTEQQRQELDALEPSAIDPQANETYVLVRQTVYERLKFLLATNGDELDDGTVDINEIMSVDDANDPWLEGYQQYRSRE